MILDLTLESGVEIDYNARVVDVDPDTPAVMLADERVLDADIIVGADGVNSIVRSKLSGIDQKLKYGSFSNYS